MEPCASNLYEYLEKYDIQQQPKEEENQWHLINLLIFGDIWKKEANMWKFFLNFRIFSFSFKFTFYAIF